MDAIEKDLDGTIDVSALAASAFTSEYHFRRVFSSLAGLSLSDYIRRRRLTVAAAAVVAGDEPLVDIALRYGYSSADAFTRAFRRMHGIGPTEARRGGARLRSQPRLTFHLRLEGSTDMRYRLISKDGFGIVGRRTRVPLVFSGPNQDIIDFERALAATDLDDTLVELNDEDPRGILSVCTNFDESRAEGTELDYYHAVATGAGSKAGDLDTLQIPAGQWVVFEATGPMPQALQSLWPAAYSEWFPANPFQVVPGPEIVRVTLSDDGETGSGELWLPIEPAQDRSPASIS